MLQPPAQAAAEHTVLIRGHGLLLHPAAELRRQAAGQRAPQPVVIEQHHRQPLLAQHQPAALLQQMLAIQRVVGQGLTRGREQRQGILQRRIAQIHAHLRLEAQAGGVALSAFPGPSELAGQDRAAPLQQPLQQVQGIQRLADERPLQQGPIHLRPAGPARSRRLQPVVPGLRQGIRQGQQLAQGCLLLGGDRHRLRGLARVAEDPLTQALMQLQQPCRHRRERLAQPFPVGRLQRHRQRLAQPVAQALGLGDHQLPLAQLIVSPGVQQLPMAQQPQPGGAGGIRPLPAGQIQPRRPQPRALHLQQPLPQVPIEHQGQRRLTQRQRHQQTDPPAGIAAGCQPHQGVIAPSQAAGHQAAEGEVMGPARGPLARQERLELLMGEGFQHGWIVGKLVSVSLRP